MSARLSALRELLQERFPDAAPLVQRSASVVPTGFRELDGVLPGGGLPRAKLTCWTPLGGASAVLRAAAFAVIAGSERAVWIDAEGAMGPHWQEGPLLIHPAAERGRVRHDNALRCAEVLLRSGGFALVVLSGTEPEGPERVRLTRAARDGGSALVALTASPSMAALRMVSRILPRSYRWQPGPFSAAAAPVDATIEVQARTLGWNARTRIVLPVTPYELRLSLDPRLVDRRGAERAGRTARRRR